MNARVSSALSILMLTLALSACATVPGPPGSLTEAQDAAAVNAELGTTYLQRGQLELARSKLEKALSQDRRNALANVGYGQLLYRTGEVSKAEPFFERAVKYEPENADHRNAFGIYLCQVNKVSLAERQFKTAAENPYYQTPEFALDNAGLCWLEAGDLKKAESFFRDALRVDPRFPAALLHMAQLTFEQERVTVSDAYLSVFREHSGETAESLLLGSDIKRKQGDVAGAESLAQRLLSSFPTSREAGEILARPL